MKNYFLILNLLLPFILRAQELDIESPIRYLALGDSYTIGQGVTMNARWPVQLADSLASRGYETEVLRIIATTGWRTDNLINGIRNQNLEDAQFNLVSVLIGVNNQFQSRPFSQYITEFPALIDSAIRYAGGNRSRVFIVSIPDYAYTPFGQGSLDPDEISTELDQYNAFSRHIADSLQITYFDITPISRQGLIIPTYVANDGLHPSGLQYTEWVKLILDEIDLQTTAISPDHQDVAFDVVFYPNPASGQIEYRVQGGEASPLHMFRLYNTQGLLLYEESVDVNMGKIMLEYIPDGLYNLQIISDERSITKQMLFMQ